MKKRWTLVLMLAVVAAGLSLTGCYHHNHSCGSHSHYWGHHNDHCR